LRRARQPAARADGYLDVRAAVDAGARSPRGAGARGYGRDERHVHESSANGAPRPLQPAALLAPPVAEEDPTDFGSFSGRTQDYTGAATTIAGSSLQVRGVVFYPADHDGDATPFTPMRPRAPSSSSRTGTTMPPCRTSAVRVPSGLAREDGNRLGIGRLQRVSTALPAGRPTSSRGRC